MQQKNPRYCYRGPHVMLSRFSPRLKTLPKRESARCYVTRRGDKLWWVPRVVVKHLALDKVIGRGYSSAFSQHVPSYRQNDSAT